MRQEKWYITQAVCDVIEIKVVHFVYFKVQKMTEVHDPQIYMYNYKDPLFIDNIYYCTRIQKN